MTVERKTLGISKAEATPRADLREGFALTGARYEKLRERARLQRHNPTEAHSALWAELSGSKLGGVKFSRQVIVGSAIVDFACPSRWIAVQVSPADANAELATLQDGKLRQVGVRVLRFTEDEILADVDTVVAAINAEVNQPFDKRAARRKAGALQMEETEG